MKKIKFIILFVLVFILFACDIAAQDSKLEDVLDNYLDTLVSQTDLDLVFDSEYEYKGKIYSIEFVSKNTNIIDNEGKIFPSLINLNVDFTITLSDGKDKVSTDYQFTVLALNQSKIKNIILDEIKFDEIITSNLDLPSNFYYNGVEANLIWQSSDVKIVNNDGTVNFTTNEQKVDLSLVLSFIDNNDKTIEYGFTRLYSLTIKAFTEEELFVQTVSNYKLPNEINANLVLPARVNGFIVTWKSSNSSILTDYGVFKFPEEDTMITVTANFFDGSKTTTKEFKILAKARPNKDKLTEVLNEVSLPNLVSTNLNFKNKYKLGVGAIWESSNPDVIDNAGFVNLSDVEHVVTIKLILFIGEDTMEKDFTVKTTKINPGETYFNKHMFVDRATDYDTSKFENVEVKDGRLVLKGNSLSGSYESGIIKTNNFKTLVGSWASISNVDATAEVLYKVRVDNTWSEYLSYGQFGLGLNNAMPKSTNDIAYLNEDILTVRNSKTADAFQYKIILRRTAADKESPKLSLVAAALEIPNYNYYVDIDELPKFVDNDGGKMPKLYQIDVPVIGDSICSPTSATMLLMYHGHKFSDSLPHREVAGLLYDHGNKIYGNWVTNTIGMSAFGEDTYVKRIYSFEELAHHLATVGPVALSIRGNTGLYTTNGHLIVVKGYEITEQGIFLIVNDPNVKQVTVRYSLSTYNGFTRNVIYVMEPKSE